MLRKWKSVRPSRVNMLISRNRTIPWILQRPIVCSRQPTASRRKTTFLSDQSSTSAIREKVHVCLVYILPKGGAHCCRRRKSRHRRRSIAILVRKLMKRRFITRGSLFWFTHTPCRCLAVLPFLQSCLSQYTR